MSRTKFEPTPETAASRLHPADAPDDNGSDLARGTGVSLWRQVADNLEASIAIGEYPAGSRLPSENELAEALAVNRHTVRRALAALAERGLVRATQGRGTFVAPPPLDYPIGPRVRFSEIISAGGRVPAGDLIGSGTVIDAEPARKLGLPPRSPLLRMETRHSADAVRLSVTTHWFASDRFAGFEAAYRETGSITKAFAAFGVPDYRRLETHISARLADVAEREALELPIGRIVLVIESINVDAEGVPIQFSRARFSADRVHLVVRS